MDGVLSFRCLTCLLITQVNGAPPGRDKSDRSQVSLRFLVLADWGGWQQHPYTTDVQVAVAERMAITADREGVSFILALGDNMYPEGVNSPDDLRFQTTFEEVYYHASLQIPWYIVAGNHDHLGNVKAQIMYSQFSQRWIFPSFYHIVTKFIPGGKTMDILLLDTVMLCGQLNVDGLPTMSTVSADAAEKQWNWIEQNLKSSKADYLLVVGHYPVYSVSIHGPTNCLLQRLEPLLYEYHVTAYLCGHDHNLQHIQTANGNQHMDYFITGSGAYVVPEQTHFRFVPKKSLKFFFGEDTDLGGFTFIDVSSASINIQFIDSGGTVRYRYEMRPRDQPV